MEWEFLSEGLHVRVSYRYTAANTKNLEVALITPEVYTYLKVLEAMK